jgi:RNA polymerase primary sigma factor
VNPEAFIQTLKQILSTYEKNDPIYLQEIKADLVKKFRIEIPINALETYLKENGYSNIYLKRQKDNQYQNKNEFKKKDELNNNDRMIQDDRFDDAEDDDVDDFDPNAFLEENKEKIERLTNEIFSFEDNISMIADYQKDGQGELFDQIVRNNIRLVESIAGSYSKKIGHQMEFDDLVQEGILGLMKAIKKFDPEKGYQFSTYATWWIRQSITSAIVDKGYIIRVPVHMYETINKVLKIERQSILKFNKIDIEWVTQQLDMNLVQYLEVKKIDYQFLHLASLDTIVSQEDEDTSLIDFIETRPHSGAEDVSEALQDPELLVMKADQKRMLLELMDSLKDREKDVLFYRFGLNEGEPKTLEEIGQIYKVTRERIRQIESKALKKLREKIRKKEFDWESFVVYE